RDDPAHRAPARTVRGGPPGRPARCRRPAGALALRGSPGPGDAAPRPADRDARRLRAGGRQRDASGGGRRRGPARSPVMTAAPESDPGRLLRPFVLTSGGVDDTVPVLDLASMVVAVRSPGDGAEVDPERAAVLRLCVTPHSVAEVAAMLEIPPSLAR